MSAEAKRIKILTLFELFVGLVIAVAAGIYATGDSSPTDCFVVIGEGVLTLVLAARGALIANVPARIGKLVPLFLVTLLVQVACAACVFYLADPVSNGEPLTTILAAVPAFVSLLIVVLARGMAKRAER